VESTPLEIATIAAHFHSGPASLRAAAMRSRRRSFYATCQARPALASSTKQFRQSQPIKLPPSAGAGLSVAGPIFEEIRTKLGVPV